MTSRYAHHHPSRSNNLFLTGRRVPFEPDDETAAAAESGALLMCVGGVLMERFDVRHLLDTSSLVACESEDAELDGPNGIANGMGWWSNATEAALDSGSELDGVLNFSDSDNEDLDGAKKGLDTDTKRGKKNRRIGSSKFEDHGDDYDYNSNDGGSDDIDKNDNDKNDSKENHDNDNNDNNDNGDNEEEDDQSWDASGRRGSRPRRYGGHGRHDGLGAQTIVRDSEEAQSTSGEERTARRRHERYHLRHLRLRVMAAGPFVAFPRDRTQTEIMVRTARFVNSQDDITVAENTIRSKQRGNGRFGFLLPKNSMHEFYLRVRAKMSAGKWNTALEKDLLELTSLSGGILARSRILRSPSPETKRESRWRSADSEISRPCDYRPTKRSTSLTPSNTHTITPRSSLISPTYNEDEDEHQTESEIETDTESGNENENEKISENKSIGKNVNDDASSSSEMIPEGAEASITFWTAGSGIRWVSSPSHEEEKPRKRSQVAISPPRTIQTRGIDEEARKTISTTAAFVARNGTKFEKILLHRNHGDPRFAFLLSWDPGHAYYQEQLAQNRIQDLV